MSGRRQRNEKPNIGTRIEHLKEVVLDITGKGYRHIETRDGGELCDDWRCPRCNRWSRVRYPYSHGGVAEAWCKTDAGRNWCTGRELEDELEGRK